MMYLKPGGRRAFFAQAGKVCYNTVIYMFVFNGGKPHVAYSAYRTARDCDDFAYCGRFAAIWEKHGTFRRYFRRCRAIIRETESARH